MTASEAIKNVSLEIDATPKEIKMALEYSCVQDEIQNQVEWMRKQNKEKKNA